MLTTGSASFRFAKTNVSERRTVEREALLMWNCWHPFLLNHCCWL